MEFLTERQENILIRQIARNRAVLVLGPLFGIDAKAQKLHLKLREKLERAFGEIDDDFENLFILKQRKLLFMEQELSEFYEEVETNGIYADIASLNFSAIINFTQDRYLANALEPYGRVYSHYGASDGGPLSSRLDDNAERSTFIYNVFGDFTEANSLITDYKSYYDFLFKILGDPGFFPRPLIKKIADASAIVLLGFDLKKWYSPLILWKILNVSYTDPETGRVTQRANLEEAIILAALNDTKETPPEYMTWLNRYPLNLTFIRDSGYDFIRRRLITRAEALRPTPPVRPALQNDLLTGHFVYILSNPLDTEMMQGPFEFVKISRTLSSSRYKVLDPLLAATVTTLCLTLRDQKPEIVHLSVHADEDGIIINNDDNHHVVLDSALIARIFKPISGVQLVFLNACSSSSHARIISAYSTYAIGMNEEIEEEAAVFFSSKFYECLKELNNIEESFSIAVVALSAEMNGSGNIPELWKRGAKVNLQ